MFDDDVIHIDLEADDTASTRRVAPPMARRDLPTIAHAERLTWGEEYVYDERPAPVEDALRDGEVDPDDVEWAAMLGLRRMATSREGATFVRISQDVFVIAVSGGQYLHDDRHLADMSGEMAEGLNEHSWYIVAEPSEGQMLLVEVAEGIYEHLPFEASGLLYMNTVNRHLVSRRGATDVVVLVQVSGYGPDERDAAVARLAEVLAARPDVVPE
jgi:hypothetical protein